MKHELNKTPRADALDRSSLPLRPPQGRHAKLALVRPIVAPVEEYVPAPADPRASFESAALAVMREMQRFTFYR